MVFTEDLCFDYAMNDAQDAGPLEFRVSGPGLGIWGNGLRFRKIGACRVLEVLWSRVYEDAGA